MLTVIADAVPNMTPAISAMDAQRPHGGSTLAALRLTSRDASSVPFLSRSYRPALAAIVQSLHASLVAVQVLIRPRVNNGFARTVSVRGSGLTTGRRFLPIAGRMVRSRRTHETGASKNGCCHCVSFLGLLNPGSTGASVASKARSG